MRATCKHLLPSIAAILASLRICRSAASGEESASFAAAASSSSESSPSSSDLSLSFASDISARQDAYAADSEDTQHRITVPSLSDTAAPALSSSELDMAFNN